MLGLGVLWFMTYGTFVFLHKFGLRSLYVRCETSVGENDSSTNSSFGANAPGIEFGNGDDAARRRRDLPLRSRTDSGTKEEMVARQFQDQREKLEFGLFFFMYLVSYLSGVNAVVGAVTEGGGLGITSMCLSPFYVLAPLVRLGQVAKNM